MIARGIVTELIDNYHVRVRVPKYNKSEGAVGSTPDDELYVATILSDPGVHPALQVGNIVIVAYENSDFTNPMILGMLFNEKAKFTKSMISCIGLEVDTQAFLPEDTSIGNIGPYQIQQLYGVTGNIQEQIDELKRLIEAR